MVVCAHHVLGEVAHQRDLVLRIDTLTSHRVAHLRVEVVDERTDRVPAERRASKLVAHTSPFPRSFDPLLPEPPRAGKRLRQICG